MNKQGTNMIFMLESAEALNNNVFTVPDGVLSIPSYFLDNFSQVTKVIIPKSVNSISGNSFSKQVTEIEIDVNNPSYIVENKIIYNKGKTALVYYFANEEEVTIPEDVNTIKSYSFTNKGGSNITSITLPSTLTTIEYRSINCPNLKNIFIGIGVTNMSPEAFYGIEPTLTLEIDPNNENYSFENGVLYNADKTILLRYFLKNNTDVDILNGIKEIGDGAFRYHYELKSVTIPNTVTKIGTVAFDYCSSLGKIEIPDSVNEIGDNCFDRCSSLKSIKINKKKDSIAGSPWGAIIGARAVEWLK